MSGTIKSGSVGPTIPQAPATDTPATPEPATVPYVRGQDSWVAEQTRADGATGNLTVVDFDETFFASGALAGVVEAARKTPNRLPPDARAALRDLDDSMSDAVYALSRGHVLAFISAGHPTEWLEPALEVLPEFSAALETRHVPFIATHSAATWSTTSDKTPAALHLATLMREDLPEGTSLENVLTIGDQPGDHSIGDDLLTAGFSKHRKWQATPPPPPRPGTSVPESAEAGEVSWSDAQSQRVGEVRAWVMGLEDR